MFRCTLLTLLLVSPPVVFAQDEPEPTEEAVEAEEAEEAGDDTPPQLRFYDENGERLSAEEESERRAVALEIAAKRDADRRAYNDRLENTRKRNYLMLAVLALLLMWLLTRRTSAQQTGTDRRRSERKAPVSPTELARAVFEVARDGNIDAYRGLFMNGGEANRILGLEGAERYLAMRTHKAMEDALVNMAVQVPPNAVFVGVEEVDEGTFAMKLTIDARTTALVPIGKAVKVGAIFRLLELPQ